jgi:hypothetical protein
MPFHPDDLPDLGAPAGNEWLRLLKDRKLQGLLSENIGYEIRPNKAQVTANLNDLQIKGLLHLNGNWNINAQHPLLGGLLNFNVSGGEGDPRYKLMFERNF